MAWPPDLVLMATRCSTSMDASSTDEEVFTLHEAAKRNCTGRGKKIGFIVTLQYPRASFMSAFSCARDGNSNTMMKKNSICGMGESVVIKRVWMPTRWRQRSEGLLCCSANNNNNNNNKDDWISIRRAGSWRYRNFNVRCLIDRDNEASVRVLCIDHARVRVCIFDEPCRESLRAQCVVNLAFIMMIAVCMPMVYRSITLWNNKVVGLLIPRCRDLYLSSRGRRRGGRSKRERERDESVSDRAYLISKREEGSGFNPRRFHPPLLYRYAYRSCSTAQSNTCAL